MQSPELPRAILTAEALDDVVTSRMYSREIRTVIDNIVYHDPLCGQHQKKFQNDPRRTHIVLTLLFRLSISLSLPI